jgi:hypothetical protein
MSSTDDENQLLLAYLNIVRSYSHGYVRFASAQIAAYKLANVVVSYRLTQPNDTRNDQRNDVIERLDAVRHSEYEAFEYMTHLSGLIYLTTLLDTFLSDTTRFLLLLHPGAMGRNQAVSLGSVLGAKSIPELVNEAVGKKVREVSYLPIAGRLEYLRKTFGMKFDFDQKALEECERYADLRNSAIHDQAVFEAFLDAGGKIQVRQKACVIHPTPVNLEDVRSAEHAYENVTRVVCRAVLEQVLKAADHPALRSLKWLQYKDEAASVPDNESEGTDA